MRHWQLTGRKLILPRFHCHGARGVGGLPDTAERVGQSVNEDECLFVTHWSIDHLYQSPFGKQVREPEFFLHPYVPARTKASGREVRIISLLCSLCCGASYFTRLVIHNLIHWFSTKHAQCLVFVAHNLVKHPKRLSVCAHEYHVAGLRQVDACLTSSVTTLACSTIYTGPTQAELVACFSDDTVASVRVMYSLLPLSDHYSASLLAEAQRMLRRMRLTPSAPGAPHTDVGVDTPAAHPLFGAPPSATRCEIGQRTRGIASSVGTAAEQSGHAKDKQTSWGGEDAVCGGGKQGSAVAASVFSESPAQYAMRGSRVESQAITFPQVRRQFPGRIPYVQPWNPFHSLTAGKGGTSSGSCQCPQCGLRTATEWKETGGVVGSHRAINLFMNKPEEQFMRLCMHQGTERAEKSARTRLRSYRCGFTERTHTMKSTQHTTAPHPPHAAMEDYVSTRTTAQQQDPHIQKQESPPIPQHENTNCFCVRLTSHALQFRNMRTQIAFAFG